VLSAWRTTVGVAALALAGCGASGADCAERQADFDRAEADAREWLARWEAEIGHDLDRAKRAEERTEAAADRVDEALAELKAGRCPG
jgi:hypothetical protein